MGNEEVEEVMFVCIMEFFICWVGLCFDWRYWRAACTVDMNQEFLVTAILR